MIRFLDFRGTLFDYERFSSEKGEPEQYLFPDVVGLLRTLENDAVIISRGTEVADRATMNETFKHVVRMTVLLTEGKSKAEYLANWPGYYGQVAILVDDSPSELAALAEKFPNLKLYEMRRDGQEGDGRWPVIRTLNELPSV